MNSKLGTVTIAPLGSKPWLDHLTSRLDGTISAVLSKRPGSVGRPQACHSRQCKSIEIGTGFAEVI